MPGPRDTGGGQPDRQAFGPPPARPPAPMLPADGPTVGPGPGVQLAADHLHVRLNLINLIKCTIAYTLAVDEMSRRPDLCLSGRRCAPKLYASDAAPLGGAAPTCMRAEDGCHDMCKKPLLSKVRSRIATACRSYCTTCVSRARTEEAARDQGCAEYEHGCAPCAE